MLCGVGEYVPLLLSGGMGDAAYGPGFGSEAKTVRVTEQITVDASECNYLSATAGREADQQSFT